MFYNIFVYFAFSLNVFTNGFSNSLQLYKRLFACSSQLVPTWVQYWIRGVGLFNPETLSWYLHPSSDWASYQESFRKDITYAEEDF